MNMTAQVKRSLHGCPLDNQLAAEALAATGLAIIVLDERGIIRLGNDAACAMLAQPKGGILGHDISRYLPYQTAGTLSAAIPKGATSTMMRGVTGTDSESNLLLLGVHLTAWHTADGQRHYTLSIREISDELKLEQAQHAEMTRSDSAIRGARIGVFEYDPVNRKVVVSAIWRELNGIPDDPDLDLDVAWRSRVHPEDLHAAEAPIIECVEMGRDKAVCEYRLMAPGRGGVRWMRTDVAVALRDEQGRVLRLIGAQTDITDRKTAELALRESNDQFQSAFDNAPIGKAVLNLDGEWMRVNPALCRLMGYSEEEMLTMGFRDITHPDDLARDLEAAMEMRSGVRKFYQTEKRYVHKDGHILWGLLNVGVVHDNAGLPHQFISQIVDVSEQHRLQELKSEFIATVSHELRTPMTSILGALKLLSLKADDSFSDVAKRLIAISVQNGERLNQLVSDILDFEKFSSGTLNFDVAVHEVGALVDKAVQQNRPYAANLNVQIETDLEAAPLPCPVDPDRFTQVMANLLSNAAKFSPSGATVEVVLQRLDHKARIVVRNPGEGVPEAFRARIFSPFAQAAPALTRREGGTGLGLSISRQIVEHMGGEIGFESEPGVVTEFWFTVPLA